MARTKTITTPRTRHVSRLLARAGVSSKGLTNEALSELWYYPDGDIPAIADLVTANMHGRASVSGDAVRHAAELYHYQSGRQVNSAEAFAELMRALAEHSLANVEAVLDVPPDLPFRFGDILSRRIDSLVDPADRIPCLRHLQAIAVQLRVQDHPHGPIIWYESIDRGKNHRVHADELDPISLWVDCTICQLTSIIDPHPVLARVLAHWLEEECDIQLAALADTIAQRAPSARENRRENPWNSNASSRVSLDKSTRSRCQERAAS